MQVVGTVATDATPFVTFPVATRSCTHDFVSFLRNWRICVSAIKLLNPTGPKRKLRTQQLSVRPPRMQQLFLNSRRCSLVQAIASCSSSQSLSLGSRWYDVIRSLCGGGILMLTVPAPSCFQSLTSLSLCLPGIITIPEGISRLNKLSVLEVRGYRIDLPKGLHCAACNHLVLNLVEDVRVKGRSAFLLHDHFPNVKSMAYLVHRNPYNWPPDSYGHPTPMRNCHFLVKLELQLDLQSWHTVFDSRSCNSLRVRCPFVTFASK